MMIWKFPVNPGVFSCVMPRGAKVLCVAVQRGEPQMWALVDPHADKEARSFVCVGTGHELPDLSICAHFIGSFQLSGGDLVFHLLEAAR